MDPEETAPRVKTHCKTIVKGSDEADLESLFGRDDREELERERERERERKRGPRGGVCTCTYTCIIGCWNIHRPVPMAGPVFQLMARTGVDYSKLQYMCVICSTEDRAKVTVLTK